MKLIISILTILLSLGSYAGEENHVFQDELDSMQKMLDYMEVIPLEIYNDALTRDQNKEVYALKGAPLLIYKMTSVTYEGYEKKSFLSDTTAYYNSAIPEILIIPQRDKLVSSTIAWGEMVTVYIYFVLFITLFIINRERREFLGTIFLAAMPTIGVAMLLNTSFDLVTIMFALAAMLALLIFGGIIVYLVNFIPGSWTRYAHSIFSGIFSGIFGYIWYRFGTPLFFMSELAGIITVYVIWFILKKYRSKRNETWI